MPKAPTLTEKQMKFAELLIFGNPKDGTAMSASEAAVKACYRTRPRQSASELQNRKIYPLVVKYRDELKEEVMQKYGINYQKHLEELGKLRDKSSKLQQMSAAINAEKTRGQVGGLNIERKLIKVDVDYDKLSPEELQNTLNSMFNEDNEIIKNVTPVQDAEVLEEESNPDTDSEEK